MSFDLEELTKAIALHGRVARIVVAGVQGSTPRETGASMLVWQGGQSGTIGGGALEFDAANRAFAGTRAETISLGPSLGQCCGGSVNLVTEIFDRPPKCSDVFSRSINSLSEVPLAISRQHRSERHGESTQLIFEGGWLSEPIQPSKIPLWVYGAGHVGRAIVNTLAPLPNYAITWIDTSASRFPGEIPTSVTQLCATHPALTVRHAPSDAVHLILTYSHALDLELCHQVLSREFRDAGLIGSKTKWARFRSRLQALAHTDAQISRITCPIGDPSLGKHPQEIAVGVATSLLSRRGAMQVGKDHAI